MARRATKTPLPLLVAWLAMPVAAHADRPTPTLHERPPANAGRGRSDRPVGRRDGGLPSAIETSSGRIDAPAPRGVGERDGDGAPLYPAPPEPGSTPPPQIRPDAATGKEGALHYRVVFDPSVAPFKRDLAFDRANADGSLGLSGEGARSLQVRRNGARPGHELFWGHVTLELVAGRRTPLPSVAPTSELLGMQADPPLPIRVLRDEAGNTSVAVASGDGADTPRRVELRYLMDAPSTYFSAPLGPGPARDDPPVPKLDAALQKRLAALWPTVGVRPDADRQANLVALTGYFRSFVPGPGPQPGPELVTELIRRKKGICRHRSHGFVLVAWSLGIPTHYVMNDAHAFVEAWAVGEDGGGHWLRIDLGGGADSLELHGADDHHLHRPLHPDSLPRPPSYVSEGGQRLGDASGPGEAWAGANKLIGAEKFRRDAPAGAGPGPTAKPSRQPRAPDGAGNGGDQGHTTRWLEERARHLAQARRAPGPGNDAQGDGRVATALVLQPTTAVAYVGETFRIRGALRADAEDVALGGLAIEVWLVDPRDRTTGREIGHAITAADGRFTAEVAMPMDARLGDWDLVVRFAGDRKLAPSFSRDGAGR